MIRRAILTPAMMIALLTATIAADNWPQFRGPGSLGVGDDTTLPDKWSETQNVVWKINIPGSGWSELRCMR